MIEKILFSPPGASVVTLLVVAVLAKLLGFCASGRRKDQTDAKKEYACGEDFQGHSIQPDYSQFFPFAFFFTILHVVALVIATVPQETVAILSIAVVYVLAAVIGLLILLKK
jgi:NADH:ubiquinone oxidoreductase subunit 3 (subunit A)